MKNIEERIFNINREEDFTALALEVFRFQAVNNPVYKKYLTLLSANFDQVRTIHDIPFLPIEFFREHKIISGSKQASVVFESSGTTGQQRSRHYVVDEALYKTSFIKTFTDLIADPEGLCILGLLPSYLERENSSLVYMTRHLIEHSAHKDSGFYLNDLKALAEILKKRSSDGQATLLLGVSFALLDLAENYTLKLPPNIMVMETGGMKGHRKELLRKELHDTLKDAFSCEKIYSEYGMTELLSQAYSIGNERFNSPQWMKVLIRDTYDPLSLLPDDRSGGVNIIDLANLYSCSFIATGDLGKTFADGTFEISGRFDQAEIRGCNLMVP